MLGGGGGTLTVTSTLADPSGGSYGVNVGLNGTAGGTVVLTGSNTYSGGTAVVGGTLVIDSDGELGNSSGGLVFDGGTLETTATISSARGVALDTGGGTLIVDVPNILTMSGLLVGAGGLTLELGSLVLSDSSNSYSGGTTIQNGTLSVAANGDLGNSSGGLVLDNGTLEATATFSSSRGVTIDQAGGYFSVDSGATLTLSGILTGGGYLFKSGAGTLNLSDSGNTYSGGTQIFAGTLSIAADGDLGDSGGPLGFIGGTLEATGTFSSAQSDILCRRRNDQRGPAQDPDAVGRARWHRLLTKANSGTLAISADNSSYSGGVTISDGVVTLANANALAGSTVTVDFDYGIDTGTLSAATIGGLAGYAHLTIGNMSQPSPVLTVGGDGDSTTFSGVLDGGGTLNKTGTGTLNLSGTNATSTAYPYATVNGGTLLVTGAFTEAGLTVYSGGTLAGTGSANGSVLVSGGTIEGGTASSPGMLTVHNLSFSSGGILATTMDSAGTFSQVYAPGSVNLSGATFTLNLATGFTDATGDQFTVVYTPNFFLYLFSGTFSGYPDGSTITIDGFSFTINYVNHSAVLTAQ